ncbi:MAG: CusA/CzcA family heavy metal efflux RND transporter [Candidatus Hydrogenedentes bacterium]|nr:CusA/CzcA family heavy metal efflux RND transporter [Candidatus Hydrogenedentota bacterium]
MLERLVALALENRIFIIVAFLGASGFGAWRAADLEIDAFPDTSSVQVQVNTTAPSLNAAEIEQQIALPIELAIAGLPGLVESRSVSKFGFGQVVAVFSDDTDIYAARQFITERLNSIELAEGIDRPQLGPISTGLGEVLHYVVRSSNPSRTLSEIRELHDWVVKPELLKVPGVAEVNSWGGFEKQFHVIANPEALVKYGLTMSDIEDALRRNNENVGGGQLDRAGESLLVHGLGRVSSVDEIQSIVIRAVDGQPLFLRDVADVRLDHEIRRGAVTFQGQGEALLGLGFMLLGENSNEVTGALRARLAAAAQALPEDITISVVYDRTELVSQVIGTVKHNLLLGGIFVVAVLFLLLGNMRAGLLVAVTIPMAMLFAVVGMYEMSIAASLLSLGAIDFGILVDGSVVMTEVNLRRLREEQARLGRKLSSKERLACIVASSKEIVRPIAFGMFIILVVFVPVLTLEGAEGKMFRPMAWTFIFALIGALLIAVLLSPVLSYYGLPWNARPERHGLAHLLTRIYGFVLHGAIRARALVIAATIGAIAGTVMLVPKLGAEFTPRLSEGSIVGNVVRLAGVSIPTSVDYNTRIEKQLLQEFPDEIKYVWSRIGVAEVATDPMGTELTDIFLTLHPREQWTKAASQSELVAQIQETLRDLPGQTMGFSQPIEMRMNELSSGLRSDVGIKVFGDDFDELIRIAENIQRVLLDIEGVSDISIDQITGQPTLQVRIDSARLARYGVPREEILGFVEAMGGIEVGVIHEGQRVFPLVVRLPDALRTDIEALKNAPLPTESGAQLTLQQVADVVITDSPATINREWGRRLIRVQTNVRDRDVASFVAEAQRRIADEVVLPQGYIIEWGGQFENLQRAQLRLAIVVPLTLLLVFLLLYFSLGSLRDVVIIYTGVPFAAIGGILALSVRGIPFSVSAAVGFIALSGIAVLNGQIMVSAIRGYRKQGLSLLHAVLEGGKQRLRPVLATAITDAAGFIPMAMSTGVGAEVQRPLATVVVGGMISGTLLTLFLLPILYLIVAERVGAHSEPPVESKATVGV